MSEVVAIESKSIIRDNILAFESEILKQPDVLTGDCFPLKHSFADGIYVREITIPAKTVLTGKIHKHSHPNFLMKGVVKVFTESGGMETLTAPCSMISVAGTKRVLHTITECVWTTVHHNPDNITDIAKLEDIVIAKSYEEYESFRKLKSGYLNRIKTFIKTLL